MFCPNTIRKTFDLQDSRKIGKASEFYLSLNAISAFLSRSRLDTQHMQLQQHTL